MALSAFASQIPATCSVNRFAIGFGAAERSNLEPFDGDALLSELEDWANILEGEPEVVQRLAVFAEAARSDGEIEQDAPNNESAPEPSP